MKSTAADALKTRERFMMLRGVICAREGFCPVAIIAMRMPMMRARMPWKRAAIWGNSGMARIIQT